MARIWTPSWPILNSWILKTTISRSFFDVLDVSSGLLIAFVDSAINSSSPAIAIGFQPSDVSQVGPLTESVASLSREYLRELIRRTRDRISPLEPFLLV
jgi:hypothetical protein